MSDRDLSHLTPALAELCQKHLEAIRNGKPVKTEAGKLNLPPLGDGCTLATRAVLLGGKQFLQSMTIEIEPKHKETT